MTVLADYAQHDRLHVGPGEDILEDAARAYLHDRLYGKDTLLMAGTDAHGRRAVPPRPRRPDPLGHRQRRPTIRLRDGAHACAGDWIMARRNDTMSRQTGQPEVTNRDVLRIFSVDPDGRDRCGWNG